MADPFVAEIRIFPFNFAPRGWAWCDGQLLPLSQNTALFSLLGTTYGGNGKSNFALPDLQGRAPAALATGSSRCRSAPRWFCWSGQACCFAASHRCRAWTPESIRGTCWHSTSS